jgi:hypothetical protein
MALFITLGLISRPSAKMLNLAQHADYAQHLSVYGVSCTVQLIISASPNVEITSPGHRVRGFINPCN